MQTPAGKECRYFYGDYFRGRNREECRLLKDAGLDWQPGLCRTCPMPDIQRANACEHLRFRPSVKRPMLILPRQVQLAAHCDKCECQVTEPRVGCGQCHDLHFTFQVAPNDENDTL